MTDRALGESAEPAHRICERCGSVAADEHKFCAICGHTLPALSRQQSEQLERRRLGGTRWAATAEQPADIEKPKPLLADMASEKEHRVRKRRRHKKRWYRRPLVVAPLLLLLLILGVAGVMAYRASSTFDEVAQLSTPPSFVQDATEGEGTATAGLTFDTAPAVKALEDAGVAPAQEKSGGVFGSFKDAAGDVSDLAAGAAVAAGVKDPSSDELTILILGVDARPGAPIDIGVRPDAIMLLHLNPTAGTCRGLAIPRDALVPLPGYGDTKVNHALMLAGIPYQKLVISQYLGVTIDRYALIDFEGFKQLVDAVGGVPVTVPADLALGETVIFTAGPQIFDGDQALRYARYRGEDDLDVGRVRRQQQIIRGLVQVAQGRNIASDIGAILPAVEANIRTDLSPEELVTLADLYRTSCGEGNLELDTLQGSLFTATFPDPLFNEPLAYVAIDEAVMREKVSYLME